jgi:heat-inducible transcriptional repressor
LALVPGWQEHRLQHIEIAPVGDDQLLVLLVTDNNQVLHSLMSISDRPQPARLRQLNDLLNREFSGKPLAELTEEALQLAVTKLPRAVGDWLHYTPALVRRGLEQGNADTHMHVEGATYIFEQQDLTNLPRLRALMEALQEESVFAKLFSRAVPGEIMLSIGTENPHPGLEDCAVVFTSYYMSDNTTGRVGVLGPKRMHYRQVISTVDAVVNNLDKRF